MGRWRGGVQVAAGRRELPAERGEAGCGLSAWRDAGQSGGERCAGWAGRVKGRERGGGGPGWAREWAVGKEKGFAGWGGFGGLGLDWAWGLGFL